MIRFDRFTKEAQDVAQRAIELLKDYKHNQLATEHILLALIEKFRVKVEDSVNASKTFDMLMGAEVPPRTRFIQTHAHEVRNLDI